MRFLSSSASAPKTVMITFPTGVLVSILSETEMKCKPHGYSCPNEESAFPDEEKQHPRVEITLPAQESKMPTRNRHFPMRKSKILAWKSLFLRRKSKIRARKVVAFPGCALGAVAW